MLTKEKRILAMQEQIVNFLRTFCLSKGISQTTLAKRIGVTRSVIASYEKIGEESRVTQSLHFFEQLASLEELSLTEFFKKIDTRSADKSPWGHDALKLFNMMVVSHQKSLNQATKKYSHEEMNAAAQVFINFLKMDKGSRATLLGLSDMLANRNGA